MARREITQADAAEIVLREAARPLHREEITKEIIKRKLPVWGSKEGPRKTPQESIGRALTQEIANRGEGARFEYVDGKGSGVFRLRRPEPRPDSAEQLSARPGSRGATGWVDPGLSFSDGDLLVRMERIGVEPAQFIREAVLKAITEVEIRSMEEQHRRGYEAFPIQRDEFTTISPDAWDEL